MAESGWDRNRFSGSYRHRRGPRHPEMETDQNACDSTIRPGRPGTPEHVVDTTHPGQTYIKLDKTREVLEILQRAADLKPEVERELEAATKETGSELQTRIQELETENRELREKNEYYEMTINQYKNASNTADRIFGQSDIKQEKEDLQGKLKSAENLIYKLQDEVQMEQERSKRAEHKAANSTHDYERAVSAMEKERQESEENFSQLENKYKEYSDRVTSELVKERRSGKECRKQLEDQLIKTKNLKEVSEQLKQLVEVKESAFREKAIELDVIRKELNETKSRLSMMMGSQMKDGNPYITDLSDKHRPTKVAEMYNELYDNEWTDAFDALQSSSMNHYDEKDIIEQLHNILMAVDAFCKAEAESQREQLRQGLLPGCKNDKRIPDSTMQQIKEFRRLNADCAIDSMYEKFISSEIRRSLRCIRDVPDFVKQCVHICWLMALQDPNLVFFMESQRSPAYNRDIYKAYTKTGMHIQYVVWPPLLLHENGPLLARGIAQCFVSEKSMATVTKGRTNIANAEPKKAWVSTESTFSHQGTDTATTTAYSDSLVTATITSTSSIYTSSFWNSPTTTGYTQGALASSNTWSLGTSTSRVQDVFTTSAYKGSMMAPTHTSSSPYDNNTMNQTKTKINQSNEDRPQPKINTLSNLRNNNASSLASHQPGATSYDAKNDDQNVTDLSHQLSALRGSSCSMPEYNQGPYYQ